MRTKRDWKAYNEQLVQRGEILLDVNCLQGWQDELRMMNENKQGRNYSFSDSLIMFLAALKVAFRLGYREAEGLARGLSKLTNIPVPDYSTVNRRMGKLDLDLGDQLVEGEPMIVAVDSTGMQVVRRKGWMRKKRKGFVKIHVAIDTKTMKVVSLEITDDKVHDSAKFKQLIEGTRYQTKIDKVLADGGYDSEECFALLAEYDIEAAILPRKNARNIASGKRSQIVKACQKNRWEWKQQIGYGQRNLVESVFSSFVAMFGKRLFCHKWEKMIQEIRMKMHIYNLMVGLSIPS